MPVGIEFTCVPYPFDIISRTFLPNGLFSIGRVNHHRTVHTHLQMEYCVNMAVIRIGSGVWCNEVIGKGTHHGNFKRCLRNPIHILRYIQSMGVYCMGQHGGIPEMQKDVVPFFCAERRTGHRIPRHHRHTTTLLKSPDGKGVSIVHSDKSVHSYANIVVYIVST